MCVYIYIYIQDSLSSSKKSRVLSNFYLPFFQADVQSEVASESPEVFTTFFGPSSQGLGVRVLHRHHPHHHNHLPLNSPHHHNHRHHHHGHNHGHNHRWEPRAMAEHVDSKKSRVPFVSSVTTFPHGYPSFCSKRYNPFLSVPHP